MSRENGQAANYYSKDFDWDELREEVESNPSLHFHMLPYSETVDQILDAQRDSEAWDKFHARHYSGKFFKERRYLFKEFPELASPGDNLKLLEVGCGNGSTVLPILCGHDDITVYACDCSNEALERANEIIDHSSCISASRRFFPFLCDFSTTGLPSSLACDTCSNFYQEYNLGYSEAHALDGPKRCYGAVNFVTLIFTLSALPLSRMPKAIKECFAALQPGGLLLFRDYGIYDMTMLRFQPEQRIGYREYLRPDGTRSYFFCLDTIRSLTSAVGFIELELEYCCVKSVNRRNGKIMKRVWVHGKFQKPSLD